MRDRKDSILPWYGYLLLALLVFAIFMFDWVSYYGIASIAEKYQWSPLMDGVVGHTATIVVWGAGSVSVLALLKRKWQVDLWAAGASPGKAGLVFSILCVVVMTAVLWLMNGGVKPLLEYQSAIRRLGSYGWTDFILQNIYYVLEMLVALLMCALGQRAGEILTGKRSFPWGAVILGILWGSVHFFSKNYVVGLVSIGLGFLLGLPYLFLNRNAKLAWLFMCMMFIL